MVWDKSADNLKFNDNVYARFGNSNDLQIFHNGSHSFIQETAGGTIRVGGQVINIQNQALNETLATFTQNAGVDLYFDNAKKLDTEAYGIEVTGTVGTDTLIVTGVSTVASLIFSAGTNTNGVSYFDANGQVQSTVSPASGISTSNSILTTNASGVPIWTDTIDCGTF